MFVEVYEKVLWIAEQHRLAGNAVLSTTSAGYADVPERQKSLAQWTSELHSAVEPSPISAVHANNRHMKDPFPDRYAFTFKKKLPANAIETYYFVNPAGRCASGTLTYGRIDVTGILKIIGSVVKTMPAPTLGRRPALCGVRHTRGR